MVRLIAILAGLSCAILSGCKGHVENHNRKTESDSAIQGATLGVKEGTPCLTNLNGGLAKCGTTVIGQRRMVLIHGEVLPTEE